MHPHILLFFFFFNDTATTEIYTLSLHDALPISYTFAAQLMFDSLIVNPRNVVASKTSKMQTEQFGSSASARNRSEEHTSELQSQSNLVCRLLLEKKKRQFLTKRLMLAGLCVLSR